MKYCAAALLVSMSLLQSPSVAQELCEDELSVLAQISEPPDFLKNCLASELFFPKRRKDADEDPPFEVLLSFDPVERHVQGVRKCQMKPRIQTYSNASAIFSNIVDSFPKEVYGIDIENPRITSIRYLDMNSDGGYSGARVNGEVTFDKKIRYNYPCFRGIKIYTCSGWTRLFSYTPSWSMTVRPGGIAFETANARDGNYTPRMLPGGKISYSLVPSPQSISPHRDLTSAFMIDIPRETTAFEVNITNDLVRAAQFIANVIRARIKIIGAPLELALNGKISAFRAWNLEAEVAQHGNNINYQKDISFIRDISRDRIGNFSATHTSSRGKEESIALSAILDGLVGTSIDFRNRTSSSNASGNFISMLYEIDNEKLLDRIYEPQGTFDPLAPLSFCQTTRDNLVSELRQVFEEHGNTILIANTKDKEEVERAGQFLFRKTGLQYALSSFFDTNIAFSNVSVSRADVISFLETTPVARNFSNLSEMGDFLELTEDEIDCARSLVVDLTGNPDLLYPGHNISKCLLTEVEISRAKQAALADIDRELEETDYWNSFSNEASSLVPPIANSQYRGWYYCYRQSTLCGNVARNVIRWQPDISRFNARAGGRHNGIDVFDSNHVGGDSAIMAITRAKVFYRQVSGWGHTIFLPFSVGENTYYAVYAHLDSSARLLDGKTFSSGQRIFTTGCSGNAGNGKEICNSYCKVGDAFRSDEHLHFEILHRNASPVNKPVDPTSIIKGWNPEIDMTGAGNKVCSECKDQNCIQQTSSNRLEISD